MKDSYKNDAITERFLKLRPMFDQDYVDALNLYNRLKKKSLEDWKKKEIMAKFLRLAERILLKQ